LRGGNVILYALGLCLTFNLGRDITLITLYTFVFGALIVWLVNRYNRSENVRTASLRRHGTPFMPERLVKY
jgi:hypothetical protein